MGEKDHYTYEEAEKLIIETLIPEAQSLRFDFKNWRDFSIAASYVSTLELGYAVLKLIDGNLGYHGYNLARAMLLAAVETKNLIDSPEYALNFELSLEKSTLRKLKFAKSGNPYLAAIGQMENLDELIADKQAKCDELFSNGARVLPDEQKFVRADAKDIYDGLYREFSQHVHGGTSALISRHARFEIGDEHFDMTAFNHGGKENFLSMTTTIHELLVGLAKEVKEYCSRNQQRV